MGHFDEVCFLCGVSPIGPGGFSSSPDLAAEDLTNSLLKHFPNILSIIPTCETKDLTAFLQVMLVEEDPEKFDDLSRAFEECIAIGYFDEDGSAPRKEVDDPAVKYQFPDGRFVKKRWVDEPYCGEFRTVRCYNDSDNQRETRDVLETGVVIEISSMQETDDMSRTGAYFQGGFGNFFLSRCCFGFLEGWIERDALPPMWDGRQLSFEGELWEIINSRKIGRRDDGCLEWLEPGGAEKKLDQTQYQLATYEEEVYPVKTAVALQGEYDEDSIKKAIYDDYGYWMFVSPHMWPEAPESKDMVGVTALGFDVLPRAARKIPLSLGCLSHLASEILFQIFRHLPNVATYLNLKLVSKGMHDLVTDTKFASPVLREIIGPDPTREMFWIYPLKHQPEEIDNFKNCLSSWLSLKCSSVKEESVTARDILFHHEFPLIHFIHSLYTSDYSRNRRRLWKTVKKFEEVWVDYRRNGWEVNRFGLPYTEE